MEGERAFVGISGISDKRPAYASVVCLRPVSGAPQRLFVALFIAPEHKKCEQKRCYAGNFNFVRFCCKSKSEIPKKRAEEQGGCVEPEQRARVPCGRFY